jgi:hypothetical protein
MNGGVNVNGLKRRADKLEQARPVENGECGCPNFDVRYYDREDSEGAAEADTEEAGMCETCGGRKMLIKVVYVESRRAA